MEELPIEDTANCGMDKEYKKLGERENELD